MYDSMIMAKVKSKREALSREASHDRDADTGATVSQISAVFLLQARPCLTAQALSILSSLRQQLHPDYKTGLSVTTSFTLYFLLDAILYLRSNVDN